MRSPGRGRQARSFFTKLRSRLSFRRPASVHTDDRVPQLPSSISRQKLAVTSTPTSTSTLAETLTSPSPNPDHDCGQNSCVSFTSPTPPALPVAPQSLERLFQLPALFLRCNSTKTQGLIVLDTGAETNVMSSDMVKRLGLPLKTIEPHNLVPVHSDARDELGLTVQSEVEVDWHFFNGTETYNTRFKVLDMPRYDILLGRDDIWNYRLLVYGHALPVQRGIARSLEEGRNLPFESR